MEELIEQYLFQYKRCPLPLIGSLVIKDGKADTWHGDNKLSAPVPYIEFSKSEIPANEFIAFIATQKKISAGEASLLLQKYCLDLQHLDVYREMKLEQAGRFCIDQSGALVFKQEPLPKEFFPSISIQRVSRAKPASHSIRVGDKETTREVMTEYYSEKEKKRKQNWWIGAFTLSIIIGVALFFYFRDHKYTENFGNTISITISPTEQTYQAK